MGLNDLLLGAQRAVSSATGILWSGSYRQLEIHYGIVAAGGLLAAACYLAQKSKPAPYGKLKSPEEERKWGPKMPILLAHLTSDGPPGVFGLSWMFFQGSRSGDLTNRILASLFVFHYFQRGFIHPLIMRYGQKGWPIGMWIGTLGPNLLYHLAVGHWLGNTIYPKNHFKSPLVIGGIALFVSGFVINRLYDWKQAKMKERTPNNEGYAYPSGGLYEYIACPNYFGELIEWTGFALATQAPISVVWLLFCAATFFPRSASALEWYKNKFRENWPLSRKALLPFIY